MSKKFALIGAAGYIAPKHMRAIKAVGGDLVAVLDPHDSVGILDRYFPNTYYFREEGRFERYLNKIGVDYVSICTPNYLHDHYIRMALNLGANAICEKPLVINPDNLDGLKILENYTGKRIYPILQLRYHPVIQHLRTNTKFLPPFKVIVEYFTYRGPWYHYSWKGNKEQSGGLAYNIGIHLFDMLIHLFGEVKCNHILKKSINEIIGNLEFEMAEVYFNLNLWKGETTRIIQIEDAKFNMNFENQKLHTKCYEEIIAGRGLSIQDTEASLKLAHQIENEVIE